MAETTQDQPTSPAELLIPPFPEPDEWMKKKGMKKIEITPGMIFRSQVFHGLLLSPDEREAMANAQLRAQEYHMEQQAHVHHYATLGLKLSEAAATQPTLGSLFQSGTPGTPGAPGNLQDMIGAVKAEAAPPISPVGPELNTGVGGLQTSIQPPNAGDLLTMPTPAVAAQPATLGGMPINEAAARKIQQPDIAKLRPSVAETLALLTPPQPTTPAEAEVAGIKLPPGGGGVRKEFAIEAMKERARQMFQVVGSDDYKETLKTMNVQPGSETPAQAQQAQDLVRMRKFANERFLQALKAGDETMNVIAARIGKKNGMEQATFMDLPSKLQDQAMNEWMDRKGYLSAIQGAGSAAAHENVKRVAALAPAQVIMDSLDAQVGKLFTANGPLERAKQTPGMNWSVFTQSNPDAVLYNSLAEGFLAKLARAAGEVGVLTEQDVKRAKALLPVLTPVPDSAEVALGKLKQLRQMIDEIASRQVSVEGLPTMGATITHGKKTGPWEKYK